jgi:hypothetical protein
MEAKRSPKIFISYREEDTFVSASRLQEALAERYGTRHVFWDHQSIEAGTPFDTEIVAEVNASTTLIAVIGKRWLEILKHRESEEVDYLRLEIATALKGNIRVIPVLVEGATLPNKRDLPDDLKDLVKHDYIQLNHIIWREDVKRLIKVLDSDFNKIPFLSVFGGTMAGLLVGTVIGTLYVLEHESAQWWRILLAGFYGLVVGAILSFFINYGIGFRSPFFNTSSFSKVIVGAVGGALGGILAGIVGGSMFFSFEEGPVEPNNIVIAVAASAFFITLGILLPDLKVSWNSAALILIILLCVTLVTASATLWGLQKPLRYIEANMQGTDSPFAKGVLALGAICGGMSGIIVSAALQFYDNFKERFATIGP